MKRIVFVLPELIDGPGGESLVEGILGLPLPQRVLRLAPLDQHPVAELAYFGMPPGDPVSMGPITMAALRAEPPSNAVRFHLSVGSLTDGVIGQTVPPRGEEQDAIFWALDKLKGKRWVPVRGRGLDHGLVWEEGSLNLTCTEFQEAVGKKLESALPHGEGEDALRCFIDDSLNLLDEHDVNKRRRDEGVPPMNLFWPWGPGFAPQLPNWSLAHGEPLVVMGQGLRLEGLARLQGLTFSDIGNGWRTEWKGLDFTRPLPHLLALDVFVEARRHNQLDRAQELWDRIVKHSLAPLLDARDGTLMRLAIVAPSRHHEGLAAVWNGTGQQHDRVPFHERVLGDSTVLLANLWDVVNRCWARPSA